MIRKGTRSDIEPILRITKACADKMIAGNIFQWDDNYPNRSVFENDLERNELFVLEKDEKVIGCIVISTFMDEEYKFVEWLTPNDNNVYIHRLAIHPKWQGNALAQELMNFAEARCKSNGYLSIRLDTFSQNKRNQNFYEQRGYQKLGDVFFPRQSTFPFHCYELIL